MRVLAVDPGGTTGFCYAKVEGEALVDWEAWHEPWESAGNAMNWWLSGAGTQAAVDVLVMEDFYITAHTSKKSQDGKVSIELIGVGRYLASAYRKDFKLQAPSAAKTFCDDKKLRAMDMWTKGLDHPRDATRHLVLYVCEQRLIDLRALRARLD
jgi:hypothetical protein